MDSFLIVFFFHYNEIINVYILSFCQHEIIQTISHWYVLLFSAKPFSFQVFSSKLPTPPTIDAS